MSAKFGAKPSSVGCARERQCRGLTAYINEVRSARFTFQQHKYDMNEPYNASLAG